MYGDELGIDWGGVRGNVSVFGSGRGWDINHNCILVVGYYTFRALHVNCQGPCERIISEEIVIVRLSGLLLTSSLPII